MSSYDEIHDRYEKQGALKFFEQGIDDACNKIMRQTDYNRIVALEKLKYHNMDIMSVVREWMGVESIQKNDRTSNQMVFDEFRSFLDGASRNYYKKKELEKAQQEYVQQMRLAARSELNRRNSEKESQDLEQVDIKVD